jgi:hypothetical protein
VSDQSHDIRDEGTTVAEAARILGITEGAVRKRVERGKLTARRTTDGRLIVHLERDTTATDTTRQSRDDRYTRGLEAEVEYLRRQLDQEREARTEERRRHDTLMAQLTQANAALAARIPELEASATQEPAESPQRVADEPERAEPHSATEGAQVGTERPQQRSGGLAPADKLPWWHYVLGLFLAYSGGFLTATLVEILPPPPGGDFVVILIVVATAVSPPGIFGFWVGHRKRNLRLWSQALPLGALVGAVALLGIYVTSFWLRLLQYGSFSPAYWYTTKFFLTYVVIVFFPAWLLFVSASLVGNTWQRRRIGRISGTTPASPVSRTTQGAAQQPRKDLTPAQQAMLGWGGTIISALITLVGTIITVRSGP